MDQLEDYFVSHNKFIEEKLELCLIQIENRISKLENQHSFSHSLARPQASNAKQTSNVNPFSWSSFLHTFKPPYIRDFRNFGPPTNSDVAQINSLQGSENISALVRARRWSRETKELLRVAVLDHYASKHIIGLIKQKNDLVRQAQSLHASDRDDIEQKIKLIDEQLDQVRQRKEERIYVPELRDDPALDWWSISAKLSETHHDPQDCRLMWCNELHWSVNTNLWTKDEDLCLLNAVDKYGANDWESIAKEMNCNRLAWQCCARYQQEFANKPNSTPMSKGDSEKIVDVVNLCRIGNFVPWTQVMYFIKYHTLTQIKYQWHKLQAEVNTNRPWTNPEDVLLLKTIERFGDKDWTRIAHYVPGRSNKSCRERYTMRLKFIKRNVGCWRRHEDKRLLSLVAKFGTNWSLVSMHLPDRNHHQLRGRYALLRREDQAARIGSARHRKLYRESDGTLVSSHGRRLKAKTEAELDGQLSQILSTYSNASKSSKSLVCRGAQDETIHCHLVQNLSNILSGNQSESAQQSLLSTILNHALNRRVLCGYDIFPPSSSTIRAYKTWSILHDISRDSNALDDGAVDEFCNSEEYDQIIKIVVSLFLWPAVLARLKAPSGIDVESLHLGSIVEKDAKNLYKVREIQRKIATSNL